MSEALLTKLAKEALSYTTSRFEPTIFYQKELDRIEVIVADCSITEKPVGSVTSNLVLLERNHVEDGALIHVGFHVEGARHFCKTHGLPFQGKVRVSEILMRMSELRPETMPAILDIAIPILVDNNIDEVEFPE